MRKNYTDSELSTLQDMILSHGHLSYDNKFDVEGEFLKRTGMHRASGALYMAGWRMEKGEYAHRGFIV